MILTDEQKRYYDNHLRCPKCREMVVETSMNPPDPIQGEKYRDVINVVMCSDPDCGWRGKVDDLRK